MTSSQLVRVAVATALLILAGRWEVVSAQTSDALQKLSEDLQAKSGSPAVFLAYGEVGKPPLIAAAGKRKSDADIPVTINDHLHLGSCTKAITSVLIARLVEQGALRWDDSIASQASELSERLPASHREVTLEQLLQHRAGYPANARDWWLTRGRNVSEYRSEILVDSLKNLPLEPPGKVEAYSNLGYMAAGLIAEYRTGESWEELMQRDVFRPLALESAGFGPPSLHGSLEQPWGHSLEQGKLKSSQQDNAAALGPAGTVHLSMADWFRFCELYAGGGPNDFLKAGTLKKLIKPDLNDEYAYGWGVMKRDWAKGEILLHAGSNLTWYSKACVVPKLGRIFLCVFNRGGDDMDQWAEQAFAQMIRMSNR
jgi:CubicO group peptidase (beta-lactamase class C family)